MEHRRSTQQQNALFTSHPTKPFCWVTHTSKVYTKISKNVDQTCTDKTPAGSRLSVLWKGRKRVSEWGCVEVGGSCRQALCVFAHTLMAEMTPSLQGPQHACAISEFHTPAPPLWAQLLLQHGSATQRTQPQLVYGPLLSQIKWSPHIKVNSIWNCALKHKRPNGYCLLLFGWKE